MSISPKDIPAKLWHEICKLRSTYMSQEITICREENIMIIEYITVFKNRTLKLHFLFNMNAIQSSIKISIKHISSRKKHGIPAAAVAFITSMLTDTFNEQIDNMPIYKTILSFDREFALKSTSTTTTQQSKSASSASVLRTFKERRIISHKEEKKQKERKKHKARKNEKEYIAFLRFPQLLEGTAQKKENLILREIANIKQDYKEIFVYVFYGIPGIICVGGTAKIIKQFRRDIGRKAVVSYYMDMRNAAMEKNKMHKAKSDKYNKQLLFFLEHRLYFRDKIKILNEILTGNVSEKKRKKGNKSVSISSKGRMKYVSGAKYEFNVIISMHWAYGYNAGKSGSLYISIFGENENKLIGNHRLKVRRWGHPTFKFAFSSIEFLNKIGDLTKVYFENHSKEIWQINMVTISVYQTNVNAKNKKSVGPSILAKQYKKSLTGASVKGNGSLLVKF